MGIFDYETECENYHRRDDCTGNFTPAMMTIKVAVVGAMSGPIAQWGDMEFNGARQAISINAKGELRAINWLAWNMTTHATRNKPLRSPTKSLMTALNTLVIVFFFYRACVRYL